MHNIIMIYLNILINNFCFILHWLLLDKTKKKEALQVVTNCCIPE